MPPVSQECGRGSIESRTAVAGPWIEGISLRICPGARIHRLGAGAKYQLAQTTPLIPKKGSHHFVRHLRVIREPALQVLDQFGSGTSFALFDSDNKSLHSSRGSIVAPLMPTD